MAMIAEDRREDEAVARAIRAQIEYQDLMFLKVGDHVVCARMDCEKEYYIKDGACNCPDYQFTAGPSNMPCKHLIAFKLALAADEVH